MIDRLYQRGRTCWLAEIEKTRRESLRGVYPKATIEKAIDWPKFLELGWPVAVAVIDIDSHDSVVMRDMLTAGVRPELLVVEHFDNHFPIGPCAGQAVPEWMLGLKLASGHAIQDTAETLHRIATINGYERIGWNRCNSFFVVKDRFTDLFR
jgi:hypothetical protein